jgi:uncharacterized protein
VALFRTIDRVVDEERGGTTRIIWLRRDMPGAEWCQVDRTATGARLSGVAAVGVDGIPHRVDYAVDLDADGRTRLVRVTSVGPGDPRTIALTADGDGTWRRDGEVVFNASDMLDVDLGFSPLTNSLPVWRLGLSVGERRQIGVAWVLFPEMDVISGRQSYERVGMREYVYRSEGFEARLRMYRDGLVERYADLWEAVAHG